NSALTMTTDEHINRVVEIIANTGAGQIRAITANDATTLTVDPAWTTDPDATSVFRVDSQAAGSSARARISPDAAFIGFNSARFFDGENTTVPNGVFVHERATRLTTRVSIASDGTVGDLASSISALEGTNARFVLFQSLAINLVSNDTNDVADIFLHDRITGATSRVSLASDGSEADAGPDAVAGVSGGGQLVVFETAATNLVADDRNQVNDIFLRDLSNSTTRRLSLGLDGINPNAESFDVTISQDGSTIAFTSSASNLALNDTNSTTDVFLITTGQLDPPMIVLSRLPATRAGAAYSAPLLTVGGTPPLTFSLSSGSLPPGIFLDSRSGRLVGMPQRAGRFQFTVAVMDADRPARLTRRTFTLLVKETPEGNRPN
ncbi:MAG: putative Ig domain-containing protein, partial [Candidatus Acidiferrales bacterium]